MPSISVEERYAFDKTTMPKSRLRGGHLSSRPFYTTLLLFSLFTAYSFLAQTYRPQGSQDDLQVLIKRSQDATDPPQCSDVHLVKDQCAFVKQYCHDDDAGLLPYLHLYYCNLAVAKPVAFIILVSWLGLLFTTIGIAASDFFSVNLSTISTILGLSESLAGVTFLAFGNGSPDVFSTFAAMNSNSASMAVGELIGAASFITGVVAGSMALVREFRVDKKTYVRDICFFIVAVGFTMFFLADGHLHFWECCAMIAYYTVYVVTVVCQHWYTTRRRRRLRREGEARSHVYGSVGHLGDELAGEPYRDDPDDTDARSSRNPMTGHDISALEAGPRIEIDGHVPAMDGDSDSETLDEDHERMVAAEVASSMRVLRTGKKRSNTITPIRPSLVGALEFRSALAKLQRESNLKLSNMHGRSYSEEYLQTRAKRRTGSVVGEASNLSLSAHTINIPHEFPSSRSRALSSGNAPGAMPSLPELLAPPTDHNGRPASAQLGSGHRSPSPSPAYTVDGSLAPPPAGPSGGTVSSVAVASPELAPKLNLQIPSRRSSQSGGSSPNSPFPMYTDSPMIMSPYPGNEQAEFLLPPPARERSFPDLLVPVQEHRPVWWWPYSVLPPPHIIFATLFPTLQGWRQKSIWDKLISTISVPTIFLLVITLPVVESDTTDDDRSVTGTVADHPAQRSVGHLAPPISVEPSAIEHESEWDRYRRRTLSRTHSTISISTSTSDLLDLESEETPVPSRNPAAFGFGPASPAISKVASEIPSTSNANDETASWNRWLVCLQIFTGPMFAVFVLWANLREDFDSPGRSLVKMVLYTLLGSLILLGLVLLMTSENRRPKYHYILCFMGFIISIAWISTIAGEVVGVLKTFGVVLGISEALLGLTIFAAGNSVGDLIADITVARLGYPVMALSACFGGPMLNILLGIGIGGVLMMVQKANHSHKKHPNRPHKYAPYRVQVGGTLMISAITLLFILVGLLIVVPMNKWILSRKIGYTLIAIWTVSTIVNVIVEVTGAWGEIA